ncbi:type II secretion system F family protein [Phytohabitans sp. ZYX-F-186]|uniref:Type II secretion system F family protein n=1 Tax=Phytohabitans maris TaxID=3071409 RepID=A0ABU0ZPM2_9ACTN|nr:type II secretion system F family protein [Phytohabitans sp. ZYX-F-186]MDQ7908357.1 type II secretion system F family protein [Phytohabitans sp. ZYX-F-186]
MTPAEALLIASLLAAAVVVGVRGRPARRRLATLTTRRRWRPDPLRLAAGLGGFAVTLFVGGLLGLVAGVAVAVALDRFLHRLEPAEARARRLREVADLPLAADLMAAGLRAGAPVDHAAAEVAEAIGGPLGERLTRVARSIRLGAEPAEAWGHIATVAGAGRMAQAAVRSSASGSALAGALTRLADDLRADRAVANEAAARRAGVLIVLPLGLCFLPAFILAGLIPVLIAVLRDVL